MVYKTLIICIFNIQISRYKVQHFTHVKAVFFNRILRVNFVGIKKKREIFDKDIYTFKTFYIKVDFHSLKSVSCKLEMI